MLGTSQFPKNVARALLVWFHLKRGDGGPLSTEKRSGRGIHSFLGHIASGVDTVPGFERVACLQVEPGRTVHLLHLLFSVQVGLYSTAWWILACHGELPSTGLPCVVDITLDAFRLWCSVRTVLRADHISHLEGVTPFVWQATLCKRVVKAAEGRRYLAC